MYNDDINLAYILFLKPILAECQRVNKIFQSTTVDVTKVLNDLTFLLKYILNFICKASSSFDNIDFNINDNLLPNPNLGYSVEKLLEDMKYYKKINNDGEKNFRARCIDFLKDLANQIRQRLPINISVLKKISMLSPKCILSNIKDSITPLLRELHYSDGLIALIDRQYCNMYLYDWPEKLNKADIFWLDVQEFKNSANENPFKELAEFALSMLCLPISNADIERVFSDMNLVKSKLRNKMQSELLNSILCIRAGLKRYQKCCFNYEIPESVCARVGTECCYNRQHSTEEVENENEVFSILEDMC